MVDASLRRPPGCVWASYSHCAGVHCVLTMERWRFGSRFTKGAFQAAQNTEGPRTIPLGPKAVAGTEGAPRARVSPESRTTSCLETAMAIRYVSPSCFESLATGSGGRGARASDVASVPPHPLVAAQQSASALKMRRSTRAREHLDDAEHLHARGRRVAPSRNRGGRAGLCPKWSQIRGSARTASSRK